VVANIAGQAVWIFPWIFVPLVMAAYAGLRAGRAAERSWYCLCLALPTVAIFTIVPLWGDRGLPHWQMPGWLMLYPVLGDYLARAAATKSWPWRWAVSSTALVVVLAVVIVGHAVTGFGRLLAPALFARGDPTLEAVEWTPLRVELARRGLLDRGNLFVVVPHWVGAGKIDQALGGALPVTAFGDEPKQFAFRYDPQAFVGRDALVIGTRATMEGVETRLRPYFASIEELPPFAFGRAGLREIELRILLARDLKMPFSNAYADRR
jgi:hypothetical protein